MLELPEAKVIAEQLNKTIVNKRIKSVIAAYSPHKFAWFLGDPQNYLALLNENTVSRISNIGGMVEIKAGNVKLVFGDGVGIRFHTSNEKRPEKHQLLIEFDDNSAISASVQMYGGLWCFSNDEFDNFYYKVAQEKPSPFSNQFNETYFENLISAPDSQKLSAKAFLATEQRIPGLGNGVLQDILWNAQINPKRKINTLSVQEKEILFAKVKAILFEMAKFGGRDTEKDIFGNNGGYKTAMSKNNAGLPCPACSDIIKKENYMGGSIYYCPTCQKP